MGLTLYIGDWESHYCGRDTEYDEKYDPYLSVNRHLAKLGLPQHIEPKAVKCWDGDMYGYSGLHYLRRMAAHLDLTGKLPSPGTDDNLNDPVLDAYYGGLLEGRKNVRQLQYHPSGNRFRHMFDHLMIHSDCDGFYLPLDFQEVIIAPNESGQTEEVIGSAPRLLIELARIEAMLEIPSDINFDEFDEVLSGEIRKVDKQLYQRYAIESQCCCTLMEGCRRSITTGAALVFG